VCLFYWYEITAGNPPNVLFYCPSTIFSEPSRMQYLLHCVCTGRARKQFHFPTNLLTLLKESYAQNSQLSRLQSAFISIITNANHSSCATFSFRLQSQNFSALQLFWITSLENRSKINQSAAFFQ
jgi:hypothetical protein